MSNFGALFNQKASRYATLAFALTGLLAGCGTTVPLPPAELDSARQIHDDKVIYFTHDYMITPGDQLEVSYLFDPRQQDEYFIAIGDQIRVEFSHYPQYDRTLNVRPDGRVTVPEKGDVMAAGLTPMQLAASVNAVYADTLRHPKCTVSLIRYGEKVRELKEAIKTATRGQSRLALVQPDGRIALPLLPPIRVAGDTIDTIQANLKREYGALMDGLYTSATVLNANGNRFYIMGAVANPGYYQLQGPTTVTQALAHARGMIPTAEASDVLLITRDEERHAVGRRVDVAEILRTGNLGHDTMVRQADIIFVPTSRLGRAAQIGAAIESLIPLDLGAFYNLSESVDFVGNRN